MTVKIVMTLSKENEFSRTKLFNCNNQAIMDFITTEQIKAHRAGRKASGLMGCITGEDIPVQSLKGISWRPTDPKNPNCFCHDCRNMWDPEGSIDLELIKAGNKRACCVYASLLPSKKETLLELMSRADDALEDFVKAQMDLFAKMDATKSYQDQYDGLSRSYHAMTAHKSYEFLKRNEQEIDLMSMKLSKLQLAISNSKDDVGMAEAEVASVEDKLRDARYKMRTYLDKNF